MTIIIKPVCFIFFFFFLDGEVFFGYRWMELRFFSPLHNGLTVTHGEAWTLPCPRDYYVLFQPVLD